MRYYQNMFYKPLFWSPPKNHWNPQLSSTSPPCSTLKFRGCRPRLLISRSNAICLRVAWTRHMRSDLFGKHGTVKMAAMTKCLAWNMPIAQHPYLITNQLSPKIPPFWTTQCWSEVYLFLPTNEHVHKKNESARTISIEPLSNQYQPYCLLL